MLPQFDTMLKKEQTAYKVFCKKQPDLRERHRYLSAVAMKLSKSYKAVYPSTVYKRIANAV